MFNKRPIALRRPTYESYISCSSLFAEVKQAISAIQRVSPNKFSRSRRRFDYELAPRVFNGLNTARSACQLHPDQFVEPV